MRTEHATITGLWPRRATELASMNESESVGSHGQEARGEGYWSTTFNPSRNSGRGAVDHQPHMCAGTPIQLKLTSDRPIALVQFILLPVTITFGPHERSQAGPLR
jgi:hypothetical protein